MKVWNRLLRIPGLRSVYRRLLPAHVACRAAAPDDAREVARLMEPLFPPSARHEALPSAQRLISETLRCGAEYHIALDGERVLAGVQAGPLLQSAGFEGCWVLGLWVHPAARGRGIGEKLIGEVIRTARERGETRLYCHIASTNTPSMNLFGKMGFRPALPDLQERIEAKFGSAFDAGTEIRAFYRDLTDEPPSDA